MKLGVATRGEGRVENRAQPPQPRSGYRLLQRLGAGSTGEVWKAEGPGGFPAALKYFRLPDGPRGIDLRALDILRTIHHPNLLGGFGAWQEGDCLVLAMELADGSLWDRFRAALDVGLPGITRDELIDDLAEAAKGIDYLNGEHEGVQGRKLPGILHTNLKPQNLLLVGGGVKVADFGSAVLMDGELTILPTPPSEPAYSAPETFAGLASRGSDQYSLAVIYCHLRTGRLPFPAGEGALAAGHLLMPPDLTMLAEAERPAVARALAKRPEDRWESCQAFLDALRADIAVAEAFQGAWAPLEYGLVADTRVDPADDLVQGPEIGATVWTIDPAESVSTSDGTVSGAIDPPDFDEPSSDWSADFLGAANGNQLRLTLAGGTFLLAVGLVVWGSGRLFGRPSSSPPPAPTLLASRTLDKVPAPRDTPRVEAPAPAAPPSQDATITISMRSDVDITPPPFESLPWPVFAKVVEPPKETADLPEVFPTTVARVPEWSAPPVPARTEVREPQPPSPVELRRQAEMHMRRGEIDRAIAVYTEVIQLAPSDAEAYAGRSRAFLDRGRHAEALADAEAALRLRPAFAEAYLDRGRARSALGDRARAVADYHEAVRLRPEDPTARNVRGLDALAHGEANNAIVDFLEVVRLNPLSAIYHYNLGSAFARLGDPVRAIAEFDEAIRLDPAFVPSYRSRGDARMAVRDRARALADFDEALRLKPDDASALNSRGLALLAGGETHRAIADFDEAIRINPRSAVAHFNRGWTYNILGDPVEAITSYDAAIGLDPKFARAFQARGEARAKRGETALAQADYAEAIRLDPSLSPSYAARPATVYAAPRPAVSPRANPGGRVRNFINRALR